MDDVYMKVELLDRSMVDSDVGVVNAARCSFDKESEYSCAMHNLKESSHTGEHYGPCQLELTQSDKKLIHYLAAHGHWTPFAHAQEVFELYLDLPELAHFLTSANLSGFEWPKSQDDMTFSIRGSLYAWVTNLQYLPPKAGCSILFYFIEKYPISARALSTFTEPISLHAFTLLEDVTDDELTSMTLRIHCPLFVKRQLETHRRNLVMTDMEDFSQNEVSRRYVDSEPEFYAPGGWRVQSKSKKQGSDAHLWVSEHNSMLCDMDYEQVMWRATAYYNAFNNRGVAHEQSRFLLPLSTYTTFWWTGSVKSWKRVLALRLRDDVQGETRELTEMIAEATQLTA